MRSPAEVAKEIRDELKKLTSNRSDYSVRAVNYKIRVTTENLDKEKVKKITQEVYHRENHSWLCVQVNNLWLPMPPLNKEEFSII